MTRRYGGQPTLGVEEEFFLIDPHTRAVAPGGTRVLARASASLGDLVSGEYTEYQVEAKTPPCSGLDEVYAHLIQARTIVGSAAAAEGLRIIASGTPLIGGLGPPPIRDYPRYQAGRARYRMITEELVLSAFHTHVYLPERELAVLVSNHLRPWLPLLIAMTANSPFWTERDSGYASWRTIAKSRWPTWGPPPYFHSLDQYDQLISTLLEMEAVPDHGAPPWDIRLSTHVPTIEIRVMDVPITAEETVAFAVLIRALVEMALDEVRRGNPGPQLSDELLRGAYWRAARDGWSGLGFDPRTGQIVPPPLQAQRLVNHLRPVLEASGELGPVTALLRRLEIDGSGAERQRDVFARRASLIDVVDHLIEQTTPRPDLAEALPSSIANVTTLSPQ